MRKLRAVAFSGPAIVLVTIFMACISLVCSLWDTRGTTQHSMARLWSRMLLALGFIRFEAYGTEKLDPGQSYVLAANHASYMDTPLVLASIPLQFRFFAKRGLFSIPFLGWHLRHAGHLPVDRGDPRASLKTMSDGAKLIAEQRLSVLLFPEGGRSEERMRPFREGAAYIAIKAGVPAVPVALVNTRAVLPMHSLLIRPGKITLHVGDPISTADMTVRDRGRLNQMLQDRVAEMAGETVSEPVT